MARTKYTDFLQYEKTITDKDTAINTFIRYGIDKTIHAFTWNNLPETIPEYMLEYLLQTNGNLAFTKVQGDYYVLTGGAGGEYDAYYRPTIYTVSNPALKFSKSLTIDKDCVLIRNDTTETGMLPIMNKYGTLITETDLSIRTALILSRLTCMFTASDDRTRESAEEMLKQIKNGELSIIGDKSIITDEAFKTHHATGSDVYLRELIETEIYLKGTFLNEIGIQANHNAKREALRSSEVEANEESLRPLINDMLYHRELACEAINEMYGLNISVELSSLWSEHEDEEVEGEEHIDETNADETTETEPEKVEGDNEDDNSTNE